MTIYTSKKTGKSYTLENVHTDADGKTRYELLEYSEENKELSRATVTESTFKRWYKKSIVIDFTNVKEPAAKNKPAKKEHKKATPSEIVEITLSEAEAKFKNFAINAETGQVGKMKTMETATLMVVMPWISAASHSNTQKFIKILKIPLAFYPGKWYSSI